MIHFVSNTPFSCFPSSASIFSSRSVVTIFLCSFFLLSSGVTFSTGIKARKWYRMKPRGEKGKWWRLFNRVKGRVPTGNRRHEQRKRDFWMSGSPVSISWYNVAVSLSNLSYWKTTRPLLNNGGPMGKRGRQRHFIKEPPRSPRTAFLRFNSHRTKIEILL